MSLAMANLMGKTYGARECYVFARDAYAKLNVELPEDPAECLSREREFGRVLEEGEACRMGDCLIIEQAGENGEKVTHIGVALDAFKFMNVVRPGTPRVDRISAWRRLGVEMRVVRPWALAGSER